jgi:hypothetical protein
MFCILLQVRAEDEEVFEMNPIEYIRRDRWVRVQGGWQHNWQSTYELLPVTSMGVSVAGPRVKG